MTGGGGARGSVMQVVVSSGPPTILNLPTGFFACWKDTSASTVRFYYNDGSIHSTAAFS
jgi:hypothetical protein